MNKFRLQVKNVETGEVLPDELIKTRCPCILTWTPDNNGYFYNVS